jgi:hypothetical protein
MRQALLHPTLVIVPFVRNLESTVCQFGKEGYLSILQRDRLSTIGTAKWSLRPSRCPALPSGR